MALRKRGKAYTVRITHQGERRDVATGTTNAALAQAAERRMARMVEYHAAGEPLMAEDLAWLRTQANDGVREWARAIGLVAASEIAKPETLTALLERWISEKGRLSKKAKDDARQTVGRWIKHSGALLPVDLDDTAALAWIAEAEAAGRSAVTLQRMALHLRAFSKWLVERGQLGAEVLTRWEAPSRARDRRVVHAPMTVEEIETLLAWLREPGRRDKRARGMSPAERACLYEFAYRTALRANEIRQLRVRQLRLDDGAPRVELDAGGTKADTKAVRVVVSGDRLIAALRELVRFKAPDAALFDAPKHRPFGDALQVDLESAGLPWEWTERVRRGGEDVEVVHRHSFHSLRASCATHMVAAGVDIKTVSEHLRHADPALTLRLYAHSTEERRREAAARALG